MKTRQQVAEEIHDNLEREWVALEVKVRFYRLTNNKLLEKTMAERDYKDTERKLLEEYLQGRA